MKRFRFTLLFLTLPAATAMADLNWSTDQAAFEFAMMIQGLTLEGIETFEESILPPNAIDSMDNPLQGGVPNLPDGFPFPEGMTELSLTLQSNIDAGEPTEPNPSEGGGLAAVSVGFGGAASDVVVASTFFHSLDLIFSGQDKTAVGFDAINLLGGDTVDVRVYDTNNEFLGMSSSPADPAGSHFIGVWSTVPIGRINIHASSGGGAEGSDNIQMWLTPVCGNDTCEPGETCESCTKDCGPCPCGNGEVDPGEECDPESPGVPCAEGQMCTDKCTCTFICGDGICIPGENSCNCPQDCPPHFCDDCIFFDNQADFETFNTLIGMALNGIEDFEESILLPSSVDFFDDPLCGGIPNLPDGFPFPNGLDGLNMCVQSNLDGENAPAPNPRGIDGLAVASEFFALGPISDIVVAGFFEDSLDLIFDRKDNNFAIGFNTISLLGENNVHIRGFRNDGIPLLQADSPADAAGTNFWGVSCFHGMIGRINIFDPAGGAEGADNIQIWGHPVYCGPCPTDVDYSGETDAADLAVLLGSWGPCSSGDPCECLDTDDDGTIGAADLAVLLGAWGQCP